LRNVVPAARLELAPASVVRRMLAVFIDFFVFFAVWIAFGAAIRVGSLYYALGFLFVVDVALTAFLGISVGRWATGIRVARPDGHRPGPGAAILRTALVFLTGWVGLVVFLIMERLASWGMISSLPSRMWWDAAAGTRVVSVKALAPQ
jgi:uncharacterized RDD family membrane protein YckC